MFDQINVKKTRLDQPVSNDQILQYTAFELGQSHQTPKINQSNDQLINV